MNFCRFALSCAALMFLPSCVVWQTGARVGALPDTCQGADVSNPVDGMVYEDKSVEPDGMIHIGQRWTYPTYVRAQEVSYSPAPPMLASVAQLSRARNVQMTGRERWVQLSEYGEPQAFVDALPEGVVPRSLTAEEYEWLRMPGQGMKEDGKGCYGKISTSSSGWKPLAVAGGIALFPVDIVLSIATNAALVPVALVVVPVHVLTQEAPQPAEESGEGEAGKAPAAASQG